MLTLPLAGELSQSSTKERKQRILRAQYGDGYDQTLPNGANSFYDVWNLVWEALDSVEYATLNTFLLAVGFTDRWEWKPDAASAVRTWKIVPDTLRESFPDGNHTQVSFQVTEVF